MLAGREFAPPWPATVATLAAVAVFVMLGRWQWDRGVQKEAARAEFAVQEAASVSSGAGGIDALPRYARVRLAGRYLSERQFLLDNRTREGRAGYEVLTPFAMDGGELVLVNRGWVASSGYRDRLPDVRVEVERIGSVSGQLDELPVAGLARGRAPPQGPWPQVTSFPTMAQLADALEVARLAGRVVLLDAAEPQGYKRSLTPSGMPPARHFGYAVQWWSFAAAVLGLYGYLNLRKAKS